MRKETSQKAFVYHSIPSSRKFDEANKQKIKRTILKKNWALLWGIKTNLYKLPKYTKTCKACIQLNLYSVLSCKSILKVQVFEIV